MMNEKDIEQHLTGQPGPVIQSRPLRIGDLPGMASPSSASRSANGRYWVYVATRAMLPENEYRDRICLMEYGTDLELGSWEGATPKWSPTASEIAYMAVYNGDEYIWIYSVSEDRHRPLVPVYESHYFMGHLSLKNFAWSPDGAWLAYCSGSPAVAGSGGAGPYADADRNTNTNPIIIIDRLLYKTKGGRGRPLVADDALTHIWVIAAGGGNPQLITDSGYNEHSLAWSPDGRRIAFISNRSVNPDDNQLHDLWSIDWRSKTLSRHTENIGTAFQPAWSPDGKVIAFLAITGKISTNDSPAEDTQAWVVGLESSTALMGSLARARCLTRLLDRRVENLCWDPRGEILYFTAGDKGTVALYGVSVTGNEAEDENTTGGEKTIAKIFGENLQLFEYSPDADGKGIIYISTDITHPAEVFHYDLVTRSTKQLTVLSEPVLRECPLLPAESFWFKSFDGKNVQGWVIKPASFITGNQYPLILVIHGGPHNMFGYAFEDRMQLLAAAGYGVLFINPRGSHGYGQDFSSGNASDWGGGDYMDLMAGLDEVLLRHDWIDGARLGVTGQSYGGYMTNRIITETTRFKAAVVDGGLSNLVSFAGTSVYHSLMESEFGGSAYDHFSQLW